MIDQLALWPGRDLRCWQRIENVLIHAVAARTVVACDRWKRLDRVEDVGDVGRLQDAENVSNESPMIVESRLGVVGPVQREVR